MEKCSTSLAQETSAVDLSENCLFEKYFSMYFVDVNEGDPLTPNERGAYEEIEIAVKKRQRHIAVSNVVD